MAKTETATPHLRSVANVATHNVGRAGCDHAPGEGGVIDGVHGLVRSSEEQAALRRGRLSVESPIGRTLMGAHPDDDVVAQTPSGPERLVVLHVS
jgi:Transcription elongation factor, GreA/GreB, C-term